ncbi:MAG: peptidase [Micropruina sp.]|uniref:peptidase n=1 Tax=Micropruina sp. TaxID=2737536 RepID=UPI0039E3E3AE
MLEHDNVSVEVAPMQAQGLLSGFLVSGRWPASTVEWARFLLLAVRMAGVPGMLPTSTVFRVREDLPDAPPLGAVGVVLAEGPVLGEHAVLPGQFADHQPPGLIVLHPPHEIRPSLPEQDEVAAGCVLLPGIPHLGLEHRAAWVEADRRGNITRMVSRAGFDPNEDADTAVLALFLAA